MAYDVGTGGTGRAFQPPGKEPQTHGLTMPSLFGAEVLRPDAGPRRAGGVSEVRRGVRVARRRRCKRRKARLDKESRREVVHIKASETMTQTTMKQLRSLMLLPAVALLAWSP